MIDIKVSTNNYLVPSIITCPDRNKKIAKKLTLFHILDKYIHYLKKYNGSTKLQFIKILFSVE